LRFEVITAVNFISTSCEL